MDNTKNINDFTLIDGAWCISFPSCRSWVRFPSPAPVKPHKKQGFRTIWSDGFTPPDWNEGEPNGIRCPNSTPNPPVVCSGDVLADSAPASPLPDGWSRLTAEESALLRGCSHIVARGVEQ